MVKFLRSAAAMATIAMSAINVARGEDLCSIAPTSYATAKTDHPDLAFALNAVEEYSIAAWYTDRLSTKDRATMLSTLTSKCSEDSRMTIVVYGIPNKDCNAGYSSGGTVSNAADYKTFLTDLTTAVGDRKVLYVVEPDAVGLLAEDGGCGSSSGYLDNLKIAVKALSANANAELYVDVGYWTLEYENQRSKVVTIIKELAASGTLKGITINTSNYRTTDQCTELCTNFQTAVGSTDMTCIIDTSRNYNEPATTDWCNVMKAGIGHPPTSETNITNLDYFMWIKPPGESDGTCSDGSVSGTTAGTFFEAGFQHLWDQGYFVNKLGMNTIAEGGSDTSASQTTTSSASQTSDTTSSQTTSSQTTDDGASQTADTTSSQTTESSASETTGTTASQTTQSSASQAADTTSSAPTPTTATPVATTATPTATTATPVATTEAPSQSQTSNCKAKRRLRKF